MKPTSQLDTPFKLPSADAGRATKATAVRQGTPVFSTDLNGADLKSLSRFNEALPEPKPQTNRVAKKKTGESEELVDDEVAISDSEEWELAQAEVAGAESAASNSTEGAGGAGAGSGNGAGAGTAVTNFSPLLFTPLLGLLINDDPAAAPPPVDASPILLGQAPVSGPTPASDPLPERRPPAPAPERPPLANMPPAVWLEHEEVELTLNASTGEIECAVVRGTDADNGPTQLSFYFWNDGQPATTSADGYFSIDEQGRVSLTEKGEAEIGAGNPALPCAPSIELAVVAFDGLNYSSPTTLTIDRVLPTFLAAEGDSPEGVDARYSVQAMLTDGYAGNAEVTLDEHSGEPHIAINDFDGNLDLIDFDGWDQAGVELDHLAMSRHDDKLCIDIEGTDGLDVHISVNNQFAPAPEGEPSAAVEFVHFAQGTTYARYDLGGSQMQDDTSSCEAEYPYFQDHGVYLVSTDKATADGDTVDGTVCNDVVVGSSEFKELISGGAGNDLLFTQGAGDTVSGGEGDDLIVLDKDVDDHKHAAQTTVRFETAATNGLDTVVGFDEESTRLELQATDTSFALEGDDVDVLTDGALLDQDLDNPAQFNLVFEDKDASATAVVAMDAASPWNLHSWLNDPSSPMQEIVIDGAGQDYSLFFLVEESALPGADAFTHLYQGADGDSSGSLSASEFTHMAQFAGVGVDAFSSSSFLNNSLVTPPPPPVI